MKCTSMFGPTMVICLGMWISAWSLGYWSGSYMERHYSHVQDANDLLKAGFTITDPEGFEVRSFDAETP